MEKEARLLRTGIVGAGPIAQVAHLEACRRARNVELYALCDVAPDLLKRMAEIHRPRRTYLSYAEMLADASVEAILIATADAFHVALALAAIRAGKHVFVEKPLGVTLEECLSLQAEAGSSSSVLQVGFNRRFDPALAAAKDFIDTRLGTPSVLNAWYCDSMDRYTMTDNLQAIPVVSSQKLRPSTDPKSDKQRYYLATHGSHLFDTARYLAGPLVAVQARWRESAGAHHWSIGVEFANGCLGHLTIIVPAAADFQEGVHLFGEGGSVQGRLHLPWYRKAGDIECFSSTTGQYTRPLGADADTYKLQLEAFAGAALSGVKQRGATAEDGTANMRALVATARSTETGEWVPLDKVKGSL